ncbi:hypothetical protein [Aquimarina sp. SS2-1]|uniref:hypothetical protein n=1 Tax=Aquimarina besae TaxID=3342247 RepID=UPI00366BC0B8
MKKKIITTVKLYVAFTLVSVIAYSCCPEQTFQLQSFESLEIFQLATQDIQDPVTTVTDEFTLLARFGENTFTTATIDFNFITSAFATSCDNDTFLNRLNEESLVVSLDKEFIYDGNTIPANSNLIDITEIANKTEVFYDLIQITFLNDFLEKSQFENQEYTFTLYVETTDGFEFEKQVSVTLNL